MRASRRGGGACVYRRHHTAPVSVSRVSSGLRRLRSRAGMSSVGFSGDWLLTARGSRLVAANIKECREPFVFDCSKAEKKPRLSQTDNNDGSSEEPGSDIILALAVSPSGRLVAVTDDNKRLLVFQRDPEWSWVSTRWVLRRCVSLVFSQSENEVLAADKSGDVYSFSLDEAEREGQLKMGHLSMLLGVVVSPDDRFIITADRDEKIRVSHHRSPYNIQSFCLGHHQFVSTLHIPSEHPCWLLSGSGDGTMKLWEYESGRLLQSCDLQLLDQNRPSKTNQNHSPDPEQQVSQNAAVCHISSSPDGHHIAVLHERMSAVQFFSLDRDAEQKLVPHSCLHLPHSPLDMIFNPDGRLWVLLESRDDPVRVLTLRQSCWQADVDDPEVNRVAEALRPHWNTPQESSRSSRRFEHLFKVSYDNVTTYLQKKQQRLEEQQMKRTQVQEEQQMKRTQVQEEQQMKRTQVQEEDGSKRPRLEPHS